MLFDGALVVLAVAAYYLLPASGGGGWTIAVRLVLSLFALTFAVVIGLRSVVASERPGQRALEALAGIVVFSVLLFAWSYTYMSNGNARSFSEPLSHTGALYFSMTTSTTIGYGDISARTDAARIVVMVQMVVNFVIIGSAVRLLTRTARRRMRAER